jgi:hypothetical protein
VSILANVYGWLDVCTRSANEDGATKLDERFKQSVREKKHTASMLLA